LILRNIAADNTRPQGSLLMTLVCLSHYIVSADKRGFGQMVVTPAANQAGGWTEMVQLV